jgi:hypothetical protein
MTKNITLAIPEAALDGARKYAAERSTTVNALVREFIIGLDRQDTRRREAIARMIARGKSGPRALIGGKVSRGWGDHAE